VWRVRCVSVHVWRGKRVAYGERVFIDRAASSGDNVGRIESPEHGGCLARINDEQQLIVSEKFYAYHSIVYPVCTIPLPSFLPHLFEGVSQLVVRYLLGVLELEEAITAMTSHVDKDITTIITQQTLGTRNRRIKSTRQHTKEILNRNL
jgi:hypothetical protein